VDNSIRFKESQVVSGALRKGDKGWFFFKKNSKGFFFGWRREDGSIPPLSKGVFF
jgi:hypothetical protein